MGAPLECGILPNMRWIVALLFLTSFSATAEEEAHLIAFSEGRYAEAASVTEISHAPDNLAFAARSMLAEAISADDFSVPSMLVEDAEALAREALLDAPNHIEARLQLAIALSLKARPLTIRGGPTYRLWRGCQALGGLGFRRRSEQYICARISICLAY